MFNRCLLLTAILLTCLTPITQATSRLESCLQLCRNSLFSVYAKSEIDGMSAKKIQVTNKDATIIFDGLDVDKASHQKNIYNGNVQVANLQMISKNKQQYNSIKTIDAHELSFDFGVRKKAGIAYGRHKLSVSDLKLNYFDSKKINFNGVKINYAMRPLSKTAEAALHFSLKHGPDDVGPAAIDLTVKKINKQALSNLVALLSAESKLHSHNAKYSSKEALAFKSLLARGVDVNFSRISVVHSSGSLSATGKWYFPKLSKKQASYSWPRFLRFSKLNFNLEVSKKLLGKMILFAFNNKTVHSQNKLIKSKTISDGKAITPKNINAMLILWGKMGLIKLSNGKYIFNVQYAAGKWKINGRKFISPKTSWFPVKLFG